MGSPSLLRRAVRYLRHDLREIIAPTSIPNPPGYVPPPPQSLGERWATVRGACRAYIDSWDSKKLEAELRRRRGQDPNKTDAQEDAETAAELAALAAEVKAATAGGGTALWPHLQRLYKTRVRAYGVAVQQFIEGYKEGFREAHDDDVKEETAAVEAAAAEREPTAKESPTTGAEDSVAAAPSMAEAPEQPAAAPPPKRPKRRRKAAPPNDSK
jgi:hypothetical protein